ncbi:hypothetical protein Acor_61590 [Acrocarpospora corrugata]|uniref:Uncharacterized protein n=1 Tax=Acrocarpospora corrugata TaxID=35763 RepID=A0A5M3WA78_9ACTN|nr:hypothetical protein [Acrocarpospora corrugata]GES04093.1 hypothetical protein Acor_61590 [Acrocarpospora corrugata]
MSQMEPAKPRVRRKRGLVLAAVLVLLAGVFVWNSSLVNARFQVVWLDGSQGWGSGDTKTFSIRFGVKNDGWTSTTIVGAGRSNSSIRLVQIEGVKLPITLEHGDTAQLEFVYEVTDCNSVLIEEWPIPVQVARPWGTETVYVVPPPQEPDSANPYYNDYDENTHWQWQVARSSYVCDFSP